MPLLYSFILGATSFQFLKTYQGVEHLTFKAAAIARGLLEDDQEWHRALEEASAFSSGKQLRELFAIILLYANPTDPSTLWERHKQSLCEDVSYHFRQINYSEQEIVLDFEMESIASFEIEKHIAYHGKSLRDFPGMPTPSANYDNFRNNDLNLETAKMREFLNANSARATNEQVAIINRAINEEHALIFMKAPAGTGKTFTLNLLICSAILTNRKKVMVVASTGIASLLLFQGRTAHSSLKIKIAVNEESICNVTRGTPFAKVLQELDILIWDEAPMQHKH